MCCKPIDTIYIHLSAVQRIRCKTMCVFVCLCGKDMAGRVCWAPIAPTRRCCTVNERKRKKRLYFLCRFTIMPIVISLSFSELFFLLVECSMFYRHLGYREQRTRTQGAESDQGVKKEKNQRKRNKTGKKKKIKIVMKKKKKQVCFVGFFCTGFSTFQFFILFSSIFFKMLLAAIDHHPNFSDPFLHLSFFHLFYFDPFFCVELLLAENVNALLNTRALFFFIHSSMTLLRLLRVTKKKCSSSSSSYY